MALLTSEEQNTTRNVSATTPIVPSLIDAFWVFYLAYLVVIVVGLVGNTLVVVVVCKTRTMHTTTNYLLCSLAVADFLTLLLLIPLVLVVPVIRHPSGWVGQVMCKVLTKGNLTIATLIVSVLTLTLLSLERHNSLLKPMSHAIRLRKENVRYAIAGTWLLALLTILPCIILDGYNISKKRCSYRWKGRNREKYFIFLLVAFVFLPVIVIFCNYFRIVRGMSWKNTICKNSAASTREDIKQKQKVVRLLVIVTCVFIICFVPYSVVVIIVNHSNTFTSDIGLGIAWHASLFLVFCSSSVNPLIYHFQSSNYRDAFKKIFHRHQKITTTRLQIHSEKQPNAIVK